MTDLPIDMLETDGKDKLGIDLIDALLQFALAVTWQNAQTDGLARLTVLFKSVEQRLAEHQQIFATASERSVAALQVIDALQTSRHTKPTTLRYTDWTNFAAALDLFSRNPDIHALRPAIRSLIERTRVQIQRGVPPAALRHGIESETRVMARALHFPLYVPGVVRLVLHFATLALPVEDAELDPALTRYWVSVLHQLEHERKRDICDQIVSELRDTASAIDLRIDQSFAWSVLVSERTFTSLFLLKIYMVLNIRGWITDARFRSGRIRVNDLSQDQFDKLLTPSLVRDTILMMSADDAQSRHMRRSVIDTDRQRTQINARQVSNSLLMVAPYEIDGVDLEHLIARFVLNLVRQRKRRHGAQPDSPGINDLPPLLQQLVAHHGVRRKLCATKKNVLFCVAHLVAENVYRYRDQNQTKLDNGTLVRTRQDADIFTASLLANHGFQYTAESLRRGRAQFRHTLLERVPDLFGLDSVGLEHSL
jgi:hypothetical protein